MELALPLITPLFHFIKPILEVHPKVKTNTQPVDRQQFYAEFERNYGPRIAKDVRKAYPQNGALITQDEIKHHLVSAGFKVKKADLEQLFKQIRYGVSEDKKLLCAETLTKEDKDLVYTSDIFEELNGEQLAILMKAFRNIPAGTDGKSIPIYEHLYPHGISKMEQKDVEFATHYQAVKTFEHTNAYKQEKGLVDPHFELRKELAAGEYLARDLAYVLPNTKTLKKSILGVVFPVIDKNGDMMMYEVKEAHHDKGLVAYFCAPLNKAQWENPKKAPMLAIFRGTYDKDALIRDISEGYEAGNLSFAKESGNLIQKFRDAIPKGCQEVEVKIAGHSLGGIDSQRFAAALVREKASATCSPNPEGDPIKKITAIETHTWNSPRLYAITVQEYNRNRQKLKDSGNEIKCSHYHNIVHDDPISSLGETLLGHGENAVKDTIVTKYKHLKYALALFTTGKVHSAYCLAKGDGPVIPEYLSRKEVLEEIAPRGSAAMWKILFKGLQKRINRIPGNLAFLANAIASPIIKQVAKLFEKADKPVKPTMIFENGAYYKIVKKDKQHGCPWQVGMGIAALLTTILSLGLILAFKPGKKMWKQACTGIERIPAKVKLEPHQLKRYFGDMPPRGLAPAVA